MIEHWNDNWVAHYRPGNILLCPIGLDLNPDGTALIVSGPAAEARLFCEGRLPELWGARLQTALRHDLYPLAYPNSPDLWLFPICDLDKMQNNLDVIALWNTDLNYQVYAPRMPLAVRHMPDWFHVCYTEPKPVLSL